MPSLFAPTSIQPPDAEVLVRSYTVADAVAITELSRQLAQHVEDLDPGSDVSAVQNNIGAQSAWSSALVADTQSLVCGFMSFSRIFEAHTRRRSYWVTDLVVASDAQGKGIGNHLMRALQTLARAEGVDSIRFEVWRQNTSALLFYDKLGAKQLDDRVMIELIAAAPAGHTS